MEPRIPPNDPLDNARAWARYRRLMLGMGLFTLTVVVGALAALHVFSGSVPIHFYIATGLGIGIAMLLMSALMGLVFLSSSTGHDEAVNDRRDDPD